MSRVESFPDDVLLELLELPDDDPRLVRVRRDPAAWSRLLALREFLVPTAAPEGARPEEAERHLRAQIAQAVRRPGPDVIPLAPRTAGRARGSGPARAPRWAWIPIAAGLLIASAVFLVHRRDDSRPLRGTSTSAAVVLSAAVIEGDAVRLSWRSVAGADAYEVTLLATDLSALGPARQSSDTTLLLRRDASLSRVDAGDPVLWRVTATRRGAPMAESGTASFTMP